MIKKLLCLSLLCVFSVAAQEIISERIKGLRVVGSSEAGMPITGLSSQPITIEFDVNETKPPDFKLRVYHCDRDWNVTPTPFINDKMQNRTKAPIPFEPAPAGVQHYRFHYAVKIPGVPGIERFPQSGNYLLELLDEEENEVLGRGKFFVVENVLAPAMKVTNRSLPSEVNPFNKVNKIEISFVIPEPDSDRSEKIFPLFLTSVEVYKNRQLSTPWRIDANDQNPNTFVDGFGTNKVKFIVDNVTAGNEYRRIDLRSADEYPLGQQLRQRYGADVSRFLQRPSVDNNGVSMLSTGTRYADYLPFRFELLLDYDGPDSIFVVGDFNGWKPSPSCLMKYDPGSHRFIWFTSLRRGIYDYQYVVAPNDWLTLEGNDWRTINVYTAFIYYKDRRFGGFDRILGYIQRLSPGGLAATLD